MTGHTLSVACIHLDKSELDLDNKNMVPTPKGVKRHKTKTRLRTGKQYNQGATDPNYSGIDPPLGSNIPTPPPVLGRRPDDHSIRGSVHTVWNALDNAYPRKRDRDCPGRKGLLKNLPPRHAYHTGGVRNNPN